MTRKYSGHSPHELLRWEAYLAAGWPAEGRQSTAVGGALGKSRWEALLREGQLLDDGPERDADPFTARAVRDVVGSEAVVALYRQRKLPRSWDPRSWWPAAVWVVCEHSPVFDLTRVWLYSRRRDAELVYDAVRLLPVPRLEDLALFRRDLRSGGN